MMFGSDIKLMGIVNVTPDSFFDGGLHKSVEAAALHAVRLLDEGADIVDIGGESTRPPGQDYGKGSAAVAVEEECRRVLPVIERVLELRPDAVISIDTVKPETAYRAVAAGASIINDVAAGQFDRKIWEVAAEAGVPYVLMHGHDPFHRTAADQVHYQDVVEDVYRFLSDRIALVRRAGVETVVADIGIGFAKGLEENVNLLRHHKRFLDLGVPLLVGVSRKSFIGRLIGGVPPEKRLYGTIAAQFAAILAGASILRVHDVGPMREFLTVFEALRPQQQM